MDSTAPAKKRRIMIITDESLIEQIERVGDRSVFQSIVIEAEDGQIKLSTASVSIQDSPIRSKQETIFSGFHRSLSNDIKVK